jgi:lysophospholipase L1-like esterase
MADTMRGPISHPSPRRGRARTTLVIAVALVAAVVLTACQPERPSEGRGTPVRRVLIVGDSMTWGLFGTTPRLHERISKVLGDRGIQTRVIGSAGGTLLDPWPGEPRWVDLLRPQIDGWNPDVVIVQSTLFPGGADPARQQAYVAAARELFAVAGSRGAHVYTVGHNDPPAPVQRNERDVAQYIQAVVAGPGVSRIPVDWWLARCDRPYAADGWHLSASGQDCHSLAITVAIDQLRGVTG